VQEGLTNIQKHADATCVKLRSYVSEHEVIIELIDDGKGFNPDLSHEGFGLRGMQERVQLLGGQLLIKTAPGQGTSIHVAIPR
jgi:signal transduction histidine kinase